MTAARWLLRVGRMDRAEVLFRARAAARTRTQYLTTAWRPRAWRREALAARLMPAAGPIDTALERLEARDWLGAHRALSLHFHRRVSRFLVSPHALAELADRVRGRFPHAGVGAAERADRILAGRFDLLGYEGLEFTTPSAPIDWHYDPVHDRRAPLAWWSRVRYLDPALGDHKIIWELNRHQHFLALGRAAWLTGRRAYRDAFVRHLRAWMRSNPPLAGINWASMLELSFRSLSWTWALHLFVDPPDVPGRFDPSRRRRPEAGDAEEPWLIDLLLALDRQLSHVHQNLSRYFSPNTHLTGEALGLYVCGLALPELRAASEWAATGRDVLLEQIDRQIAPDGGHVERSTHYQRYTLDFYLLALAMARATDDPCADRLADAVTRLASATRLLANHEGRLPLIGDDDGGVLFPICARPASDVRDSLASAAALLSRPELVVDGTPEETMWLLGNQPAWIIQKKRHAGTDGPDPLRSGALADSGYFVSKPRPSDHLVIDGGAHGYLNGGHAHADALSLCATLSGRALFTDPGTGAYTASRELRDRFRASAMHNTLTLDGRSQSVPDGPFHWKTVANAHVQRWLASPVLDYFEGVHDGYLPIVHRRRVLVVPGGPVVVVDSVLGDDATHRAEVHWHLDPSWHIDGADGGGISLRHASQARAWVIALNARVDFLAGDEGGLGWHAPAYGRVEPALTLRLTADAAPPFAVVTMFGDGALASAPSLRRLPVESEASGNDAVALRVQSEGLTDLVIFGFREPDLGAGPAGKRLDASSRVGQPARIRAGDVETDARFLCARMSDDGGTPRVAMLDGAYARALGTGRSLLPPGSGGEGLVVDQGGWLRHFA